MQFFETSPRTLYRLFSRKFKNKVQDKRNKQLCAFLEDDACFFAEKIKEILPSPGGLINILTSRIWKSERFKETDFYWVINGSKLKQFESLTGRLERQAKEYQEHVQRRQVLIKEQIKEQVKEAVFSAEKKY